jgi:hypothetical protein
VSGPVITSSARRHGVADESILHAFNNPIGVDRHDEGFTMVVGADEAGRLIEVGFVEAADETVVIVHAMPARPKHLR